MDAFPRELPRDLDRRASDPFWCVFMDEFLNDKALARKVDRGISSVTWVNRAESEVPKSLRYSGLAPLGSGQGSGDSCCVDTRKNLCSSFTEKMVLLV